jgi:hypothetical protein
MTLPEALLFTVPLLLLAGLVLYERSRRAAQAEQLRDLQQKLEIFQQSLHALTAGAAGADKRMFRLEAQERLLSERQETIENQRRAEQPYAEAIRLVQQGAGVRRLMEELSLSESEAELIFRLHGLHNDA